ncbi:MAG: helix-turn-helix domain-containing protein [Chloroflexia bacterium]
MDVNVTSRDNPAGSLAEHVGRRIRQARQERGLTQEALAGPEFTKGYVSALERGTVRPSLKALQVFARRLNVEIVDLLTARDETDAGPELRAAEEDLNQQLNYARMLIGTGQFDEAFQLIRDAEESAKPYRDRLPARVLYRVPLLRGLAYLKLSQPEQARPQLDEALDAARGDLEAEAATRNLLGVAYYQMEQPQMALEHHLEGLSAVQTGAVQDPSLRLGIYRNLAQDYWAHNEPAQATGIYEEALKTLDDLNDLQRQAGVLWGLATTFKAAGDWPRARHYSSRALHIRKASEDRGAAATICMTLAELFITEGRYEEARQLLQRAEGFLQGTGDQVLLSNLYYDYADLARKQGDLEQATRHITASIRLIEGVVKGSQAPEAGRRGRRGSHDRQARKLEQANTVRTYSEALHVAALIEEAQGHSKAADDLFRQALDQVGQTGSAETIHTINFSYGDVLKQRGDYERAVEYFQAAAQVNPRGAHLGN